MIYLDFLLIKGKDNNFKLYLEIINRIKTIKLEF